eukprot:gene22959-29144_t
MARQPQIAKDAWRTEPNDRITQLQTGRSLQEYPEQKPHYHAVHQLLGPSERWHTMQMWTRLSDGPAIGPSPRRGLKSHVRRASWAGGEQHMHTILARLAGPGAVP